MLKYNNFSFAIKRYLKLSIFKLIMIIKSNSKVVHLFRNFILNFYGYEYLANNKSFKS